MRYKLTSEMTMPYRATITLQRTNWRGKIIASWEEPYDPENGDPDELLDRLRKRIKDHDGIIAGLQQKFVSNTVAKTLTEKYGLRWWNGRGLFGK